MKIERDLCRVCLNNIGVIPLFNNNEGQHVAATISSLFNIDLISDVNLPNTICTKCMEYINVSITTKQRINDSDIYLNSYLELYHTTSETNVPGRQFTEKDTISPKLVRLSTEEPYSDDSHDASPFMVLPKTYECGECEFKTDGYKRLIYHMRVHLDIKLYECERCGQEYKTKSKYIIHTRSHRLFEQYKCEFCSKEFMSLQYLQQHLLTRETERVISCPKCDKSFCNMKGLQAHLLTHNQNNIECKICGSKFKHSTLLEAHILTTHCKIPKRKHNTKKTPCELCGKVVNGGSLKAHIKTVHFKEKRCLCPFCDRAYSSSSGLAVHIQYHINSKNIPLDPKVMEAYLKYKCDNCDKPFASLAYLKKHKEIHSLIKKYVCPHCEKEFKLKEYLDRHVRIVHERTREVACSICGKFLADKRNLRAHMIVHKDDKPYQCKFCYSSFKHVPSLRNHTNKHHK